MEIEPTARNKTFVKAVKNYAEAVIKVFCACPILLNFFTFSLRENCPNTEFFSGLHFPVFGLNPERDFVSLHIQSKCGKIQTRKNSVFGHIFTVFSKYFVHDCSSFSSLMFLEIKSA